MKLICCVPRFNKEAAATSHFCCDPPALTCPLKICDMCEIHPAAHIQTHGDMCCRFLHTRCLSTFTPVPTRSRERPRFPVSCFSFRPFCFKIVPTRMPPGINTTCCSSAATSPGALGCVLSQLWVITRISSHTAPGCCQTPSNVLTKRDSAQIFQPKCF